MKLPAFAGVFALAALACVGVTASTAQAANPAPERPANRNANIAQSHLPALSASHIYWAGTGLAEDIRAYRDNGQYVGQRKQVVRQATAFFDYYLRERCARNTCAPAVVFDFDDTLVSWYETYDRLDFTPDSNITTPVLNNCETPPIAESIALVRHAQAAGAKAYVITGRPESMRAVTEACMAKVGITGATLVLRATDQAGLTAKQYKSAARLRIEREGQTIVINVGDQVSDIAGGHAKGQFVVPNPVYFIP